MHIHANSQTNLTACMELDYNMEETTARHNY